MAQPVFTPQQMPASVGSGRRLASVIAIGAAGFGIVILLGALALWFHYGTAVFFETIASGISSCF
jgi:hypothetical protein